MFFCFKAFEVGINPFERCPSSEDFSLLPPPAPFRRVAHGICLDAAARPSSSASFDPFTPLPMKPLLTLIVGGMFALIEATQARSLPLTRGGALPLPDHAVAGADGVTFVRPGEAKPVTVKWEDVDLARLARQEVALEAARQKALLTGEKTVLGPEAARPNPYSEFLSLPVNITFRAKESRQSRIDYREATQQQAPLVAADGDGAVIQPGIPRPIQRSFTAGVATRSETLVDGTRPPIDTSALGFLEMISDDKRSASGNLLRETREHPAVFARLLAGLRELQRLVPEDPTPAKAADTLLELSRSGPVSIEAQRRMAEFLRYATERAGWR